MDEPSLNVTAAGAEVVMIYGGGWGAPNINKHVVERATKTQVVVAGKRFRREDGREVGGRRYGGWRVEAYQPSKHDPMFAELEAERARNVALCRIRDVRFHRLTTEKLERILEIIDEGASAS